MKKKLLSLLLLGGLTLTAGAQQLPNIGFDNWKTACGSTEGFGTGKSYNSPVTGEMRQRPGVEPTDWNGSSVNQQVSMEKKQTLVFKDESDGNKWVKMQNTYVGINLGIVKIGSVAPGFINLGTPWVYASSTLKDCGGGVYGGVSFSHKPDAITGRYKRTDSTGENSHIIVYLWDGTFTSKVGKASNPDQSRNNVDRAILGMVTTTANGILIASCDYTFTSTTNSDWQIITVPLTYHNTTTAPTMMNTIISAGDYWTRGSMEENTTLLADDVKFVYYSTLNTLSYDGVAQTIPEVGGTLDMSSVEYDADKLSYTLNGQTATAQHSYDEATGKLTITVSNVDADVDGLSSHTYYVQFYSPNYVYEDGKAFKPWNGVEKVELKRNFAAGWNTLCLPFDVNPSAFGEGVKVQKFSGYDANGLHFKEVSSIAANTPYLVWFPSPSAESVTFSDVTISNTIPQSIRFGGFTFIGNYDESKSMNGLYGVATIDGVQKIMLGGGSSTLKATRAYFQYTGVSNVNGMRINLDGENGATSIDGVQVLSGSFDIYNLQGICVRTAATSLEGLTPGVYVVNGKKVMVK